MTTPITHVSDTAHWVAVYRALESERPDAIFRDPYARKLAGPRGEEIVRTLPKAKTFDWPMIVRTAVMDEIILRAVRGIDVASPDVHQYKRGARAGETPRCQLEWMPCDPADVAARRELLGRFRTTAPPALVVTEGPLIY